MAGNDIGILLVEDDPADAELPIHALRQNNLINRIDLARDGKDALDFPFCRGWTASMFCGRSGMTLEPGPSLWSSSPLLERSRT